MRYGIQFVRLCFGVSIIAGLAGAAPANAQGYDRIDCAQSRLVLQPMKTCWKGPMIDFLVPGPINCVAEQYTSAATRKNLAVFAYLIVLNAPRSFAGCYIGTSPRYPETIKDVNKAVRNRAKNWSNFTKIAGIDGFRFEFPRRKCFVFARRDAPAQQLNEYTVVAYICGAIDKAPPTDADIASFVASIKVKGD